MLTAEHCPVLVVCSIVDIRECGDFHVCGVQIYAEKSTACALTHY